LFQQDDPMLARARRIALSFPGAAEKISHGRPAFYTTKIFAYYGGSVKVDDFWIQHDQSIVVLLDPTERRALLGDSHVYVPGYLGGYGWIGLDLTNDQVGWDEVGELIDSSYRSTAPKRLVAELDATR
jgi:hypothetical protein